MAESDAPTQTSETEAPAEESAAPEPAKARQEAPPEVTAALRKANKEAETLRRQLKEYEDKDKSEAEKLVERATAAEVRAAEMESQLMRHQVALTKGLSPVLAERLRGNTQEELEADADALLALVAPKPEQGEPTRQFPDLGQGRRAGSSQPSVASGAALYAAKHSKT